MQLKKLPAVGILIILILLGMAGCKNNRIGTPGNDFFIDTTIAARSVIPISTAIALQQSFISSRSQLDTLTNFNFLSKNFLLPNSESFTKDALLLLLSQKGAAGIRFYYGKDKAGVVRLVLLPVTADGKAIYTKLLASSGSNVERKGDSNARSMQAQDAQVAGDGSEAVETGQTCPPCLIDPNQQ